MRIEPYNRDCIMGLQLSWMFFTKDHRATRNDACHDINHNITIPRVRERGVSKTVRDTGGSKTVPDTGGSKPVPDTGGSKPVPDTGGSKTVPDTGGSKPVPDTGGSKRAAQSPRLYNGWESRKEREKSDEMEYVTRRLQNLESECDQLKQENPKLRLDIERLRNEKRELQEKLSETQSDYNTLLAEHEDFKRRSERERETTGQLLDELGKELGELRQFKIEVDLNRPRGDSQGELPGRYHALQTEVTRLKEENKALHDTNEDLSAQLLTNCLEEGRTLVKNKENSLAAELDHLTKEELLDKLKKQTDINIRLESYVDKILLRIMEMNPTLLEVPT